ncbi:MAG: hypothetical protein HY014_14040 [Acidobacteria bacterium]|nr:hypothetical protein [Acidobacteriota bacterium]MBI3489279.1 hypothetical protein [Acidobacteriota bacterium]
MRSPLATWGLWTGLAACLAALAAHGAEALLPPPPGPVPTPLAASRPAAPRLQGRVLTPLEMLRAMVAQERRRRGLPEATVEVWGTDEEAALKRLSLQVAAQVRQQFHVTDKRGHQELYAFMHQDPSRPPAAPRVP